MVLDETMKCSCDGDDSPSIEQVRSMIEKHVHRHGQSASSLRSSPVLDEIDRLLRSAIFFCTDYGGYYGIGDTVVKSGDRVVVLLGCWTFMVSRRQSDGSFRVICMAYVRCIVDKEAIVGSLPKHVVVKQHLVGANDPPRYLDLATMQTMRDDPRLEDIPPCWVRIDRESSKADPLFVYYVRNVVTGKLVNNDSRLTS